ncbi:hypothetical protein [Paenibacillus agricola]|uniref:GIY-YIG domain-containing protein n=1 Tax=Paenibacillus agricola TaxID=2716264 RepID=A0ABX0J479_9BACL|nr:hypothetical protein [Paenibacillus agricola]NHN29638.1 hypothetical protein [Paenibacillus agricola]
MNTLVKVSDVHGAVWLAALIMTYDEVVIKNNKNREAQLRQSDIQRLADKLCTKSVQSARISQWCNGDHPASSYNYLRACRDKFRRLTRVGEFSFMKEYPEHLLNMDDIVYALNESDQQIKYRELFEWYTSFYSKADFVKENYPNNMNTFTGNHRTIKVNNEIHETAVRQIIHTADNYIINAAFKKVHIQYEYLNKEDLFSSLKNKSVLETLEKPRYLKFSTYVMNKYPNFLKYGIGDFLFYLKNEGDSFYKLLLNKYGDEKYCKFKITDKSVLNKKGLYSYTVNGTIMYIGRCKDSFYKRINTGYGNISPKNCYLDGQATNCHINSIINQFSDNIELWIAEYEDELFISDMEVQLIKEYKPEWNIALK